MLSALHILITVSNCMPAIPRESPVVKELYGMSAAMANCRKLT